MTEFWNEPCHRCKLNHLTCWSAVQYTTTVLQRLPLTPETEQSIHQLLESVENSVHIAKALCNIHRRGHIVTFYTRQILLLVLDPDTVYSLYNSVSRDSSVFASTVHIKHWMHWYFVCLLTSLHNNRNDGFNNSSGQKQKGLTTSHLYTVRSFIQKQPWLLRWF